MPSIKLIFSFLVCLLCFRVYAAETCPAPAEIKANQLRGWQAYSNDNGTDLTPEQLKNFERTIGQFIYTRWIEDAPEGESHCYYSNNKNAYAYAYLAKENLIPDTRNPHWTVVSDAPQCQQNIADCPYINTASQ